MHGLSVYNGYGIDAATLVLGYAASLALFYLVYSCGY
jgi:hypothetical protein